MTIQETIQQQINENPIVLYMKGDAVMPLCGFSAKAVNILKLYNKKFMTVNVLQDDEIRQGIKVFSNWPTIPQLYVQGEFVGGCDIMIEMHESGELKTLLEEVN